MSTLDMSPGALDLIVWIENRYTVNFNFPSDLSGRTFTAKIGNQTLSANADGDVLTVLFMEEDTADLQIPRQWKLIETTDGSEQVIITGFVKGTYVGSDNLTEEVTVTTLEANVVVQVIGPPGPVSDGGGDGGGDPTEEIEEAISAHVNATDPHFDRQYADDIVSMSVAAHVAAVDPHGDRAYADGASAAVISAHVADVDPHADRAYADTQVAEAIALLEAYADAKIAALVGGSVAALDTIQELGAALGNNPNLASDLATLIGTKASIAALAAHIADQANPHVVTPAQIGLGNVSNLAPADLPVSTAQAAAIAVKITLASVLTGLLLNDATAVTAADTLLAAIGKLQAQESITKQYALGALGYDRPSEHGLVAWTHNMSLAGGNIMLTSGMRYLMRFDIHESVTFSQICAYVNTAGATLTAGQNLCAVYDSAGNRLAITADQSSNWLTTGEKDMSVGGSVVLPPGMYYLAVISTGSTPVNLRRGYNTTALVLNYGQAANQMKVATQGVGTNLPTTFTLSSNSPSSAQPFWLGLKA